MYIDKKRKNKKSLKKYGPFWEKKTTSKITNTILAIAIISRENMVSWHIRIECCIFF